MKITKRILALCSIALLGFFSCNQAVKQESWTAEWLGDNKQEMVEHIEEQFQGFSRTMTEVSHRFAELYWSGQDQNWEYAEYQREHIEEAMDQGFVRRPERKASSQQFMQVALPEMAASIEAANPDRFQESFNKLVTSCNTCHNMEEVPFITVAIPQTRNTVVYY